MTPDELFMRRALELARLGTGSVSPNPRVGCVIVHKGKIIGEGWHQKFGEAHAEVNAVRSVGDPSMLSDSTVYVNLEPCSHFGKTPPCADLLIEHSVKKVVIANRDSNPEVSGRGIEKLRNAGIEVVTGVLETEGHRLNQSFFTFIEKKRPYVILKWAQSANGYLAGSDSNSKWISNEYSRQLVHRWRAEEDAVLVGTSTAEKDNPGLTVRDWSGRDPIRVVIDRYLRLPDDLALWKGPAKTIRYNVLRQEECETVQWVRLEESDFINGLIRDLYKRSIQSVIVEGGRVTLDLFIKAGLWDEARVFSSSQSIQTGVEAPILKGELVSSEMIFSDELKVWIKSA